MARSGWTRLSTAQRKRLEGSGRSGKLSGRPMSPAETRAYWEAGGDLRAGYGHPPKPRRGAAPRQATEREALGLGTTRDYADLQRWRKSGPAWLPRSEAVMGTDTAAILSQLPPPSRWKAATFAIQKDGTVVMTVTPRGRGYPSVVTLPDRDAMAEVTSFIRSPVSKARTKKERERLEREWQRVHIKVNVVGTQ